MTRPELPAGLRRFILTSLPSVPYLEALLLLRGEPAAQRDAQSVARRLYLPEAAARELLSALAAAGVASQQQAHESGTFCYQPASPELAAMLDQVAHYYGTDLVGVTSLIHSRIGKRAQQFADAFVWRKDT